MKHFPPHIHIEIERWRYYMPKDCYVSNLGRIKDREGRIKNPTAKNNYLQYRGKAIHRMVMEVWNPVPNYATMTVDHLNHNTRDNRVSNLEWVSFEENQRRAQQDDLDNTQKSHEFVYLNGVEMSLDMAKKVMLGDSSFKGRKDLVDKFFKKVMDSGEIKRYASYTVVKKVG